MKIAAILCGVISGGHLLAIAVLVYGWLFGTCDFHLGRLVVIFLMGAGWGKMTEIVAEACET